MVHHHEPKGFSHEARPWVGSTSVSLDMLLLLVLTLLGTAYCSVPVMAKLVPDETCTVRFVMTPNVFDNFAFAMSPQPGGDLCVAINEDIRFEGLISGMQVNYAPTRDRLCPVDPTRYVYYRLTGIKRVMNTMAQPGLGMLVLEKASGSAFVVPWPADYKIKALTSPRDLQLALNRIAPTGQRFGLAIGRGSTQHIQDDARGLFWIYNNVEVPNMISGLQNALNLNCSIVELYREHKDSGLLHSQFDEVFLDWSVFKFFQWDIQDKLDFIRFMMALVRPGADSVFRFPVDELSVQPGLVIKGGRKLVDFEDDAERQATIRQFPYRFFTKFNWNELMAKPANQRFSYDYSGTPNWFEDGEARFQADLAPYFERCELKFNQPYPHSVGRIIPYVECTGRKQ